LADIIVSPCLSASHLIFSTIQLTFVFFLAIQLYIWQFISHFTHFSPEDGVSIFLRNVTMASQSIRPQPEESLPLKSKKVLFRQFWYWESRSAAVSEVNVSKCRYNIISTLK
jgi:hypothetical protein